MGKTFTGALPRTGQQRSAEQVSARLQDLLNFINEIFELGDNASNYNKLLGFDGSGELTVVDPYNAPTSAADGQTIIYDLANSEFIAANSVTGTDKNYSVGPDGAAGQAAITDGNGNITFTDFPDNATVIGQDKTYTIGPDGTAGQIPTTDGNGNITFIDAPSGGNGIVFTDVNGNFTAVSGEGYNIDEGAQITINAVDVNNSFIFRVRPKFGENLEATPAVILYNGVNLFQGLAEDINLNLNIVYTIFSQDGTTLQASVEGLTQNG